MMDLTEVVIAPEEGKKGRSFRALHLASATADALWSGGQTTRKDDVLRPVHAVFLGSEAELRPFAANLQLGRLASTSGDVGSYRRRDHSKASYEFLKSAGYRQIWQRCEAGAILTVYLPDLFHLDPGMVDPEIVRFVLAPSVVWVAAQGVPVAEVVRHARRLPIVREANARPEEKRRRDRFEAPLSDDRLAGLAVVSYLFAAYLDRRTRAPIPPDGRFYLQVMLACLKEGLASWSVSRGYRSYGQFGAFGEHAGLGFSEDHEEGSGLLPGLAFRATHEQIEKLLAEQVDIYFRIVRER